MKDFSVNQNDQSKYDVIIIGAGPAGLECARQLRDSKLSVLLVEKNKTIGPKTCAGGLTNLTSGFGIPNALTRSFPLNNLFIKDHKYKITLAHPLKTITRLELGQYQLEKIVNSKNLTILTSTVVSEIKDDRVITLDNKTFKYKYLVGADGANSIVRKHLKLRSNFYNGLYYDIPKVTDDFVWLIDPKLLKTGYVWVFPHKHYTNIGVYYNPVLVSTKFAREVLEKFIVDRDMIFSPKDIKGAQINYNYEGYKFNNIYLAGEAAGLVSRATGEGISFALISGQEIAKKILNPEHKKTELRKIIKIKRRQERMLKILDSFPIFHNIIFLRISAILLKYKWFQIYIGT